MTDCPAVTNANAQLHISDISDRPTLLTVGGIYMERAAEGKGRDKGDGSS